MTEETTVVETPEGAGSVPTTETTPEAVTSPEVKAPEATPEKKTVDTKMQDQIDNLNTALRQERESSKICLCLDSIGRCCCFKMLSTKTIPTG